MRVALILPGSIWYAPYVRIYTTLLDEQGIDYAIISWNREGDDNPEGFQYNVPCERGHGSAGWKAYKGYIRFIKKTISEQGFEKIIVFGPQMTCLLSTYLLRHFKDRYMIDYRDLSIEQKVGFKQLFAVMLNHSKVNVISSPGFRRCLPKQDYFISHNFDKKTVKEALTAETGLFFHYDDGIVDVLTIGGIRDFSSNIEVVKSLSNRDGFKIRFVGKGGASQQIETYCKENQVGNVSFHGYYQKKEEPEFIRQASFMNIFYPRVITHDTAMSNRFYNSLIYKRPMIVTKHTIQGDYAEQHCLGIALEDCSNLSDKITAFLHKESYPEFVKRCNNLLIRFLKDQESFERAVIEFAGEK